MVLISRFFRDRKITFRVHDLLVRRDDRVEGRRVGWTFGDAASMEGGAASIGHGAKQMSFDGKSQSRMSGHYLSGGPYDASIRVRATAAGMCVGTISDRDGAIGGDSAKMPECVNGSLKVVEESCAGNSAAVTKTATRHDRVRCSHDGCTNLAREGGVCIRHGAKVKNAATRGARNLLEKEVCAEGTGQGLKNAVTRGVPTLSSKEVRASSMGQ